MSLWLPINNVGFSVKFSTPLYVKPSVVLSIIFATNGAKQS